MGGSKMTWILDLIDHQTGFKNYNPKTTCLLDGPSYEIGVGLTTQNKLL
jgi:hypothetical protein